MQKESSLNLWEFREQKQFPSLLTILARLYQAAEEEIPELKEGPKEIPKRWLPQQTMQKISMRDSM